MPLLILEEELKSLAPRLVDMDFSWIIRECRIAIGVKQYRAAEFIGISSMRLKNLETGYLRDMPSVWEIDALSRLYDLNPKMLKKKAKEHCHARTLRSRPRTCPGRTEVQDLSPTKNI